MTKLILLFAIAMLSEFSFSQGDEVGTIDAQRPTLTESYSIIGTHMLQFENGFDYYSQSETTGYGTFLRGSVTNKVELRFFSDYERINMVGAKFIVMEPAKTDLGIGASLVYGRDVQGAGNDYRLALTKSFDNVFFTYNFGYSKFIYNIGLIGIPFADKFNYFIEYYNALAENRIHTGFTWIPKNNLQLDINGGWMNSESFYTGVGVSFRLR